MRLTTVAASAPDEERQPETGGPRARPQRLAGKDGSMLLTNFLLVRAEQRRVDLHGLLRNHLPSKVPENSLARILAHLSVVFSEQPFDCKCQIGRVFRCTKIAIKAIFDEVGNATNPSADKGKSRSHRLKSTDTGGLHQRGQDRNIGGTVIADNILVSLIAQNSLATLPCSGPSPVSIHRQSRWL
jgi:hypothetical protein